MSHNWRLGMSFEPTVDPEKIFWFCDNCGAVKFSPDAPSPTALTLLYSKLVTCEYVMTYKLVRQVLDS